MARFSGMGGVKNKTNKIIDDKIEKQQVIKKTWSERRPKTLAVANKKTSKTETFAIPKPRAIFKDDSKKGGFIENYWFPILCLATIALVAVWTFYPDYASKHSTGKPAAIVPEPTVNTIQKPESIKAEKAESKSVPSFDIVRVDGTGSLVIAGRFEQNKGISININKKIVATIKTDKNGEFAYNPKNKLKPGNYTVQLLSDNDKSDVVFLYVDQKYDESLSLLMTKDGSRILQAPTTVSDENLTVSKIDYVANKRIIVQGKALPRLRVSLSMNDKLLGVARVSDHKNFGLGAGVGKLKSGEKYSISIKLHDSVGSVVSHIDYNFIMPKMSDKPFYIVRKDDTLWVIAKNFLGDGIQFSVIATANKVKNPNLIYPNQKFQIPVSSK